MILSLSIPASSQQIWFSPGDDLNVKGVVSHPDFMQLFTDPQSWPRGSAHVDVLQLRAPWFLRMPDSVTQLVLSFIRQHHMSLAVPLGFVTSEACGIGVEGLGTGRTHAVYPREMKKRGIELDYVVMDEPLFYGHDYDGKNSCQFTIAQVAASVIDNMKMVRTYYPNVKFVLAEPEQALAGGVSELSRFLDLYEAGMHELPAAVRFDIHWAPPDARHRDWRIDMPLFIKMLQARGIGYSMIFNAGPINGHPPDTDGDWIQSAKTNVLAWERTIPEKPLQVVIQTWSPHPVRITPETDATTMTGYLKWYLGHAGRLIN